MQILIAGAGIAGLFLYHELNRRGISAQIFERVPKFEHVGGGLILKSPATLSLTKSGLIDEVRRRGVPLTKHQILDQTGKELGCIEFEAMYERGLTPGVFIHRADFHDVLQRSLPPGALRLATKVDGFEVGEDGVTVHLEGQEKGPVHGDVLVGADGLHSVIRERHFGVSAHPLNFKSYRWIVSNQAQVMHFMEFMGEGMSLGMFPTSREELFMFLSVHGRPGGPAWHEDVDAFKRNMAQFTHPAVLQSLGLTTQDTPILCTDIHEVTMSEYYDGRCVLIGDSAHAMSPSMGTGSAMAMGDAIVLAEQLERVKNGETDYPEAFHEYYLRRYPKVEAMRAITRGVDAQHHAHNKSVIDYRNAKLEAWLHDHEQLEKELMASLGGDL